MDTFIPSAIIAPCAFTVTVRVTSEMSFVVGSLRQNHHRGLQHHALAAALSIIIGTA
jgi:hypothetical protein